MSLVLTRKIGQAILIRHEDVEIVVRITKVATTTARVAIDAPDGFEIIRDELENEESGTHTNTDTTEATAETGRTKRTPAGV